MRAPRFSPLPIRRTGDDKPAATVWAYVWRMSGWHQVCVALLALMVAGLWAVPLDLQRRIVDDAIADRDLDSMILLAGLYLGVVLLQAALKFTVRLYQAWLSESAIRYTRGHLLSIFDRHMENSEADSGEATSIINAEVDKLGGFVGDAIAQPIVQAGTLVALLGYMIMVEPLVATISTVILAIQIAIVPPLQACVNKRITIHVTLARRLGGGIVRHAEGSGGSEEMTAAEKLDMTIKRIFRNRMMIHILKWVLKGLVNLMNNLAPLSVLAIGGWLVIEGQTSIGVVVAFMSGFDRLAAPVRGLIAYFRQASQARVQHDMIAKWM